MRVLILPAVLLLLSPAFARAEPPAQAQSERGVWPSLKRTWTATADGVQSAAKATTSALQSASDSVVNVFLPSERKAVKKLPLEVQAVCSPSPLILKGTKNLSVLIKVHNSSKRTQLLEFPSSQRADAVLRDASGKIVARASSNVSPKEVPSLVTVNPGERLEYALSLPTEGMQEGKKYTLECALVGQEGLTASLQITAK